MKKQITFFSLAIWTLTCHAQLNVNADGNIGIKGAASSNYSVNINSTESRILNINNSNPSGSNYAIYASTYQTTANAKGFGISTKAYSRGSNGTAKGIDCYAFTNQGGKSYGVVGCAANPNDGVSFGIVGTLGALNTSYGAGIYGGTNLQLPTLDDIYAGYFKGPVKVQGNLNVTGNITGVILSAPSTFCSSETRQPEENLNSRLQRLNLNTYYLNMPASPLEKKQSKQVQSTDTIIEEQSKTQIGNETDLVEEEENAFTKIEAQVYSKRHYGLDTDELETLFPDLVYENEDGSKSINYVEMVPILVQVINELSTRLAVIESGNAGSKRAISPTIDIASTNEKVTLLNLGQNKPNPFGETTSIPVSVPEDVKSAFLYVYNLNGSKVAQVDIATRGKTSVSLSAANLSEGMYLYSLVADGKIVQTRRMIVEK